MSLLGIDIGTTGCKAIVFAKTGEIISSQYREYPLIHPNPGWNELDPELVLNHVKDAIKKAVQKTKKDKVRSLAVSCQGEAVIPVDKNRNCLYNAIITFDSRTEGQYRYWKRTLGKEELFKITGMPLNPMYTINKIMWLKKNRKDIYRKTFRFLCFEDFLHLKLGVEPCISYSLAARTSAFDIVGKSWSHEILKYSGIDIEMLSKPVEAGEYIGSLDRIAKEEIGVDSRDIICAGGGHDQACGAFGAGIIKEGYTMNAAGTSDTLVVMLDGPKLGKKMLDSNYPCAPYVIPGKYTILTFNLTGGLLLRWYKESFCNEEYLMAKKQGRNVYEVIDDNIFNKPVNIFILPHFVGSGTPTLDSKSRGIITGLDLETDKAKLSRAVLESTAYDLRLNIEKLEEMDVAIKNIIAIGGGAKSARWLQIKADISEKKFLTLKNSEAASLGAAMLGGICAGVYNNYRQAVESAVRYEKEFKPSDISDRLYKKRYLIYKDIYRINRKLLHRISELNAKNHN